MTKTNLIYLFRHTSPFFSSFVIQKMQQTLQQRGLPATPIQAHAVYYLAVTAEPTPAQLTHIAQLLEADPVLSTTEATQFVVIPRVGTISPWSSKATDIFHHCGLDSVHRVEQGIAFHCPQIPTEILQRADFLRIFHDPMTQSVVTTDLATQALFQQATPTALKTIDILQQGEAALCAVNTTLGLALSTEDITYLTRAFQTLGRNPTDVELMMFAQANSEHCRHKIFNATWRIDGVEKPRSLFSMIKNTHQQHPQKTLSAYIDNGAVMTGWESCRYTVDAQDQTYRAISEPIHLVIKVETHNHPTAIAPFPGAATGAGGEIRDGGATGRGAKPKAGVVGFSVSNLQIPEFTQVWENSPGKPIHIASALQIMLEGPIGAASFNNEFGRPSVCGYFRTFEQLISWEDGSAWRGYHKPIMIAGGLSTIRENHVHKETIPVDALVIVLGGPAMEIGLGGGAASSKVTGQTDTQLDFASVQRSNPEMERRCQEVIDTCWALGNANPILSIHDVGAGGLANAIPELLSQSDRGGELNLRAIPNDDHGMSPLAIWCNESQERYVIAIHPTQLSVFEKIAYRERCPFAVVGIATEKEQLHLSDPLLKTDPVDLPAPILFGNTPKLTMTVETKHRKFAPFDTHQIDLAEAAIRLLKLPTIAAKTFLITIGDRSVGGLVTRDQFVGPWQMPVADVAVTATDFTHHTGEAMAIGERAPIACINPAASARMSVGEAITNIAAACIDELSDIKLSANWMAASQDPNEALGLYQAVEAIGLSLCPALDLAIPVGKDSLFMSTKWKDGDRSHQMDSPLSLIVTAFGRVSDIRKTITPMLQRDEGDTELWLIDLARGKKRLGGSCLAQVYNTMGHESPDLENPSDIRAFFNVMKHLREQQLVLAYHDRSDGGLFVTLCEMAFAGHTGITVTLDCLGDRLAEILFNEELGAVIQIRQSGSAQLEMILRKENLADCSFCIGRLNQTDTIDFYRQEKIVLTAPRATWLATWAETSYRMQALRDNPDCATQAFEIICDAADPGLHAKINFDLSCLEKAPPIVTNRPRVAILREQGVNGQIEMAAAFDHAGFSPVDVLMQDILSGDVVLDDFVGLAACGGFSYGDVLGAGRGWANTILYHSRARDVFATFFDRPDTFALGICNGCQMFSHLNTLIPGTQHWPQFRRNLSAQFEARLSLVEILPTRSLFFEGMAGAVIPIVVSHGEGQAVWPEQTAPETIIRAQLVTLRYVDHHGQPTMHYPENPNGSPLGITGLTNENGRVMLMMPHPERVFKTTRLSWHPKDWGMYSPWFRLFQNARRWVG